MRIIFEGKEKQVGQDRLSLAENTTNDLIGELIKTFEELQNLNNDTEIDAEIERKRKLIKQKEAQLIVIFNHLDDQSYNLRSLISIFMLPVHPRLELIAKISKATQFVTKYFELKRVGSINEMRTYLQEIVSPRLFSELKNSSTKGHR